MNGVGPPAPAQKSTIVRGVWVEDVVKGSRVRVVKEADVIGAEIWVVIETCEGDDEGADSILVMRPWRTFAARVAGGADCRNGIRLVHWAVRVA